MNQKSYDTAKRPVDISDLDFGECNHILHDMVDVVLGIYPIPEPEPESLPCLSPEGLQGFADTFKESSGTLKSVSQPTPIDPYPAVPAELKALRQWVLWKVGMRDGKATKIPKQITGENAKSNDASTWTDYPSVVESLQKDHAKAYRITDRRFDGIGFVFSPTDLYTGIDLDNCIVDGKVRPWAKEIIDRLEGVAYIEVSPSGKGIKIWTRAKLPAIAKHKVFIDEATGEAIEAYDTGRYFTVTGRGKYAIGDGQSAIDWILGKYLKDVQESKPARPPVKDTRDTADIKRLIENSRQQAKYNALMRGDTTGYGSPSEADEALCCVVAFWTRDTQHIDAIFRQSGLYRDKWDTKHRADGATYGEMTIEKALAVVKETYTPLKQKKRKRRVNFYEARAKRRRYGYQR